MAGVDGPDGPPMALAMALGWMARDGLALWSQLQGLKVEEFLSWLAVSHPSRKVQ